MRASEPMNEQRVLPSLWPDGAGYSLDRVLKGADLPSVWPGRGAYETGRSADLGWQAQEAEAGVRPGAARQPAHWESRRLLACLRHWAHRLVDQRGLRA
jgi:hypothetical protein